MSFFKNIAKPAKQKTLRPWSEEMFDGEDHEDEIEAMYKECKPNEFYFGFSYSYGGVVITLTPADYFDREGYCFDQGVQIEHLLPKHLYPMDEVNYSFKGTPREVQAEMLALGFIQKASFDKMCLDSSGDLEEIEGKNILDCKPYSDED